MMAPLVLWAVTGFIFLTKPGYEQAYEQLSPMLYAFDQTVQPNCSNSCTEMRLLKTVLGYHLLVRDEGSWKHLDPFTSEIKAPPTPAEITALVRDAINFSTERYGSITAVNENKIFTDTGVVITLDWNSLTLRQEGPDTRLIDTLYRVHYLQWFGSPALNRVFGIAGLIVLMALSCLGLATYLRGKNMGRT
jgi:hypothetical protein